MNNNTNETRSLKRWYGHLWWALVPFCIYSIATILLVFSGAHRTPPPQILVPILNTILIFGTYAVVTWVLMKAFWRTGEWHKLLLGAGVLLFGLAWLLAGWFAVISLNSNSAVHFPEALVASAIIFIASVLAGKSRVVHNEEKRTWVIFTAVAGVLAFVSLITVLTLKGAMPEFYSNAGPTALRQIMLVSATVIFGATVAVMLFNYSRSRNVFLLWISLGLLFITLSYIVAAFILTFGSWLPWGARFGQYCAAAYFFVAGLIIRDEASTHNRTVSELVAEFGRQTRVNYELLVNSASDAIIAVDGLGRIISWNPAAEKMFGYSRVEAIGMPFADLTYSPEQMEVYENKVDTALLEKDKPENPMTMELKARKRSEEEFAVELTLVPKRQQTGRPPATANTLVIRDITERKMAEESLRKSEEKYRSLFDRMGEGFAVCEMLYDEAGKPVDYRFLNVNPMFEKYIGFSQNQIIGKTIRAIVPNVQPKAIENFGNVVLTGELAHFENYSRDLARWFDVYAYKSEPGRFAMIILDITERKRAEEALQESNRNYRALFNNQTVALAYAKTIFDDHNQPIDYVILDVNSSYEKQVGISRERIVVKKITEAFPGVSQDLIDRHNHVAVTGEDTHFEIYEPTIDMWFEVNVYCPQRGYFVALSNNITERKKAEEALKESEAKANANALIKYAPTGIYEIDFRGPKFVSINDAMCSLTGYTREELFSIGPAAMLDEESRTLFADRIRRQLAGEKIDETVEYRVKKKDGSLMFVVLNVSFPKNRPGTAFVIGHDVTERKKSEDEIQKYARELEAHRTHLEEMVMQRTRELQHLTYRLIMVQEDERRKISRELHDQTGQSLTVTNLLLAKAERSPENFQDDLQQARQLIKEVLSQVRTLSSSLHPGMMEDLGLISTLNWYLNDFRKKTGIASDFEQSGFEGKTLPLEY